MKKNETITKQNKKPTFYVAGQTKAWLIVVCNAGKEALVKPQLLREGYEVYRPMAHKQVTHNWEKVIKAVPVFPNYLFVHKQGEAYERISGMLGVAWIYPTMILDRAIQRMKAKETDGYIEIVRRLDPEYGKVKIGDKVKTLDGMIEVVVSETIDANRVAALSGFMNGNSRLTLDLSKHVQKRGVDS